MFVKGISIFALFFSTASLPFAFTLGFLKIPKAICKVLKGINTKLLKKSLSPQKANAML